MSLSDIDLWRILQVTVPAYDPFLYPERQHPNAEWKERAKQWIVDCDESTTSLARYTARLVSLMEEVNRYRDDQTQFLWRQHEFRRDLVLSCLRSGLVAAGLPAHMAEDAYIAALDTSCLHDSIAEDWHPGMPSGSGRVTCVRLTYLGQKATEDSVVDLESSAQDTEPFGEYIEGESLANMDKPAPPSPAQGKPTPELRITVCGGRGNEVRYIDVRNMTRACDRATKTKIRQLDKSFKSGEVTYQNGVAWKGPVFACQRIRTDGQPANTMIHLYDMANVRDFFGRIDDSLLRPYEAILCPEPIQV